MPSLDDTLQPAIEGLRQTHRYRARAVCEADGAHIIRDGTRYLSFASNDYFGLAQKIKGLGGASSSALVTGYSPELHALEQALAKAKGTQAALVFSSGYLANVGTISALVGKGDLILADKLAHACMLDGAALSGASLRRFKHNDLVHLEALLAKRSDYRRCLILTETVFSMDGDRAPLAQLQALATTHDAWLMSDDAHGLGFLEHSSPAGRGGDSSWIQMGTLSKGLGALGGYVCGSQTLIDYLANHARSYLFTTALPPVICEAAHTSLAILSSDAGLRAKPLILARQFADALGLPEAQSPIVPLIIGSDEAALKAANMLSEKGVWVPVIRPPTVPEGTARLRFSFTARHTDADVAKLTEMTRSVMPNAVNLTQVERGTNG